MHLLGEVANETWLRLEDLLDDLDVDGDRERQTFVDDTRAFFRARLSIYEQRRAVVAEEVKSLSERMCALLDELQLPRVNFDQPDVTLREQRTKINAKIDELQALIFERDKELIQLRQAIEVKAALIGNVQQIDAGAIASTSQAQSILSDLTDRLNNVKHELTSLLDRIHSLDPQSTSETQTLAQSFVSLTDVDEAPWLTEHPSLTSHVLHATLAAEHQQLYAILLAEVVALRAELEQVEPPPPSDLQQELANLRLRKRYLALLANFPHQLTSRSSLDEIRQTYERLTASLRAQAKKKLIALWDQLDVPADQRLIPQTKENEDDYLAMKDEIQRLEAYVESIRPLLIKIQKREWFKKEMVEFEKHAGDPARLRGNSTQLLKEERFRKDLSREFPKLTDDLRRMVAEWEETTSKKLIYGGEPYLETMTKEKLGVDFDLLHLRLLTKCQLLVQPISADAASIVSSIQSPPSPRTPPPHPPRTPPSPRTPSATSSSSASSTTIKPVSRIPTMNFVNSNRKTNKPT